LTGRSSNPCAIDRTPRLPIRPAGYWIARSSRAMTVLRLLATPHPRLPRPRQRNSLRQGIWAAKFFRIAGHWHDPLRIGVATSKGCGKFPAPEGSEFAAPAQGNVARLAGNSQGWVGNRRGSRDSGANVSCQSFFSRSFVDGANFDGRIDKATEFALHFFGLPAAPCPRVFCAGLLAKSRFCLI
jgi:hypothetical protein